MAAGPEAPAPIEPIDPIDQPGEVREDERLDLGRLSAFVLGAVPGATGPVEVSQFRKGHSNLTYLVTVGGREAVLRRAPRGANIKSAHDMRREFTILGALQGIYPKAPRPLAFCDDESIIGARFYLMERVRGVILRGTGAPPGVELGPGLMRRLSESFVDDLAALHAVDVRQGPLASLGKPQGYVARQVAGWTERYGRARTDDLPDIEAAAAWLAGHQPAESGAALIHNDYKYDNLVLDPADLTHIVALLDWEMATVGDPIMDLGSSLGYWVEAADPADLQAVAFGPTRLPGNLTRRELVERYEARSGRSVGGGLFPYVYGLFKLAVIAQQIYKRFVEGHSSDPRFGRMIVGVRVLGAQARRAIERGRIDRLA
jgi:aminoglycoside phosphotransferase (APT) family kinase protein